MDYFPLVRKVEFLVGKNVPLNITSIDKEELERGFRNAQKAFNTRYESLVDKNGTDIYAVNKSRSTNLTIGDRGMIILGHFMSSLMNQYIHDHLVRELLLASGDHPELVYGISSDFNPGDNLSDKMYPKVTSSDPLTVPADISAWFERLTTDVDNIVTFFQSGEMSFKSDPTTKIAAVRRLMVDFAMLKIIKDDHRFQTYLLSTIRSFLMSYRVIFGYGANEDKYIYMDTKSYDVFEALSNSSKMFDLFKAWHMDNIYSDYLKRKVALYKIDFSSFTIDGGYVVVPEDHYGKMIKDALDGVINGSMDELTWSNQIDNFIKDAPFCAKISKMFRTLKQPVALPECFDAIIPLEDFDVTGKIPELEGKIAFFKMEASYIIPLFEKFLGTICIRRSGNWFPTCSARIAIYNGIKTIYRFDFASPVKQKYLLYKVLSINDGSTKGKKKFIDDVVPLQAMSPEKGGSSVLEDAYITDCFKKKVDKYGNFYGSVDLSEDELRIMVEQFKFTKGSYVSEDHWKFQVENTILTILPPSQVVQQLNILKGDDSLRQAEGMEYQVREIDTSSLENVDLVDLMFAYRKYELDDPKSLENLYNKRLSLVGHLVPTMEGYKLTDAPVINAETPNYGVLLQVSGIEESQKTQTRSYRPKYMGVEPKDIVKAAKSRKFTLRRKLEVEFPVAKSSVAPYYINKMDKDKIIYASGNTRFGEPVFKIIGEDFDDTVFKDCYKGKLTLDLAADVRFKNVKDPLESEDGEKISFTADAPISSFDVVNVAYDEKMAIVSEDGPVSDWKGFFNCALVNRDYESAACECVRDCFGQYLHGPRNAKALAAFVSDITMISNWIAEHFNVVGTTLMTTLGGSFTCGHFSDLQNACAAKDTDEVVKCYKALFGESSLISCKLPLVRRPSYKQILDDSLRGVTRFPAINVEGDMHVPFIPGSVVKDVDSVQRIASLYVNQKLASITDLW